MILGVIMLKLIKKRDRKYSKFIENSSFKNKINIHDYSIDSKVYPEKKDILVSGMILHGKLN